MSVTEDPLERARKAVNERLEREEGGDRQRLEDDLGRTGSRRARLDAQLARIDVDDPELGVDLRGTAADLEEFCGRLLTSSFAAGERRGDWHRVAGVGAALTAVAAASGGSALLTGLKGTGSTIVGVVILLVAVFGAAFNALGAQQEYERNRAKRRAYDALWFEAWNYALYELVSDHDPRARAERLNQFSSRWEQIGQT